MKRYGLILAGLATVAPLKALDDGRGRFGVQVDYTRNIGTDTVPMIGAGPSYAPQGTQDGGAFGLGLVMEWRVGSASTYTLRRLALVPSISIRMGSEKDGQGVPSLVTAIGGQPVSLANANINRKTTGTDTTLSVPVRWYLSDGGRQGEGFFLETGPQWIHTEQKVDLELLGTSGSQAVAVPDSIRYTKNRAGWTAGLGGVFPIGEASHMAMGLQFSRAAESGVLPTKSLRAFFQFMF